MIFTERKGKYKLTSKKRPSVRFREINYPKKNVLNTGFDKSKRRSESRKPIFGPLTTVGLFILIFSLLLSIFLIWFFVFSTNFLVKNIEVKNSDKISNNEIVEAFYNLQDKRILFFIPGNHIVFLTEEALNKVLKQKYPFIDSVTEFSKDWPDKIKFSIIYKVPIFLFKATNGSNYVLDKDGYVISKQEEMAQSELIELESENTNEIKEGQQVVGSEILEYAKNIQSEWLTGWDFRVKSYKFSAISESNEIQIHTNEGWYIFVDIKKNPKNIIESLKILLDKEIKDSQKRLDLVYIDLRVDGRAFYCLSNEACSK